jgi:hypothetical protein
MNTGRRKWSKKCMIIPVTIRSLRESNRSFKDIFGSHNRKTFDRFTTKHSCTWNITHNTESGAV